MNIREQNWYGRKAPPIAPSPTTMRAWLATGAIVPPPAYRPRTAEGIGILLLVAAAVVAGATLLPPGVRRL